MNRLREIREERGFLQRELAEMIGVATSTIKRWEADQGQTMPYPYNIDRLCQALDVTASELGFAPDDISLKEEIALSETVRAEMIPPKQELASTYFVPDRSNEEELLRLDIQDQILTTNMGGVLPEQPDPTRFQRVLDVGCGTGGWLIEVARAYPSISLLVGVDISGRYVEYARRQAQDAGVSDRVEFHVMDSLLGLEFPDSYFDLVNQRLGTGWLRTWEWPKIVQEYKRVSRPGGVVRVSEYQEMGTQDSQSLVRLNKLTTQAFVASGRYAPNGTGKGMAAELISLFMLHGLRDVQTRLASAKISAGTQEWQNYYENAKLAYITVELFLRKWTQVPGDYKAIYQRMLTELQHPDFGATWRIATCWAKK